MGKGKKKSEKNAAFKKVKLKIGKKLTKTNTTDSTFKAKKVVLLQQLQQEAESSSANHSYRGVSLDTICTQLGHYNQSVRRNAIVGAKQILSSAPHLIERNLRTLVPAFARLIAITDTDSITFTQLKTLLELVCSVSSQAMSAHFTLFIAHVLHGLTHSHENVRSFSLTVLHMLLERFPDLCRDNSDIFQTVTNFIASGKKTNHKPRVMINILSSFLSMYDLASKTEIACKDRQVSMEGEWWRKKEAERREGIAEEEEQTDLVVILNEIDPFYFPVLGAALVSGSSAASIFASPQAIIDLCQSISPLLARFAMDDDRMLGDGIIKILEMLGRSLERQQNKFVLPDFDAKFRKATEPLRKVFEVRTASKRMANAAAFLK